MKSKWIVSGINVKKNVFRAYYFNDISFSITTALLGSVCACVCAVFVCFLGCYYISPNLLDREILGTNNRTSHYFFFKIHNKMASSTWKSIAVEFLRNAKGTTFGKMKTDFCFPSKRCKCCIKTLRVF